MLYRLLATAAFGLAALAPQAQAQTPAADGLVEGRDYTLVQPAQPTASSDKIEVLEVFGYWCIHCANLDPSLERWKKTLGADVQFSYVPAIWQGGVDEYFARAFYAAETMGVLEKVHSPMFIGAAVERTLNSPETILDFVAEKGGVDRAEFEAMLTSFTVNAKVNRVKQTLPRYAVDGTPAIIVNGKYRIMALQGMSMDRMLEVTDKLIARERAAKQG
jgi:protein dithiol oxidoreductase (disulfide-forming)